MGSYVSRAQGVRQFWGPGGGTQRHKSTAPRSPWLGLMFPAHQLRFKAQKGPNQLPEHPLYLPNRSDHAPSMERPKMCPTKSAFGTVNPVLQLCLLFPKTGRKSVPEKSAPRLPLLLSWCWVHPSLKIQRKLVLLADLHLGQACRSCLRQDCPVRLFLEMPRNAPTPHSGFSLLRLLILSLTCPAMELFQCSLPSEPAIVSRFFGMKWQRSKEEQEIQFYPHPMHCEPPWNPDSGEITPDVLQGKAFQLLNHPGAHKMCLGSLPFLSLPSCSVL